MEAIKKYDSIKHGYNRASGGAVGRSYFMPHTILWLQKGKHYPDFKKQCEHWLTYADDPKVATIINFGDLLIQESEWFKNDGYDEFEKIGGYLKGLYDWFVSGIDVSASSYNAYKELHKVCREVFDKKTEEENASIED